MKRNLVLAATAVLLCGCAFVCTACGGNNGEPEEQPAVEQEQAMPEEGQPAPEEGQPAPEEGQPAPEEEQPAPEEQPEG